MINVLSSIRRLLLLGLPRRARLGMRGPTHWNELTGDFQRGAGKQEPGNAEPVAVETQRESQYSHALVVGRSSAAIDACLSYQKSK